MACGIGVGPATAVSIVESGWNRWSAFAQTTVTEALNLARDAAEFNIDPVDIGDIDLDISTNIQPRAVADPTAMEDITFDAGTVPTQPTVDIMVPTTYTMPVFTGTEPDIFYPSVPTNSAVPPDTDIVITYPDWPTSPSLTYPDEPNIVYPEPPSNLPVIVYPDTPTLNLPTFDAEPPEDNLVAPDYEIDFTEEDYSDAQLTAIKAKVSEWLEGGTGLPDAIWDAIWDRARENEEQLGNKQLQEAETQFASRGFTMYSGQLARTVRDIRQAVYDKSATLNRDIAIKQAEMEVENIRFALQQGLSLQGVLIESFHKSQDRLLKIQELQLDAAIKIFNAQVSLFNAKLEAYKVSAAVYESQIRAELAKIEIYKAQIDGERLKIDASKLEVDLYIAKMQGLATMVEVYKAQLSALVTQVQIYTAQVDAAKSQIDGERLKVETLKTRIDAYSAEIGAFKSEIDAYTAQIGVNKTKAEIYDSTVSAYANKVQAYKAANESNIAVAEAHNNINEFNLKIYQAQIEAYRTLVQAEQVRIQTILGEYDAIVKAYQAKAQVASEEYRSQIAEYGARVEANKAVATVEIEKARLAQEQILRIAQLESTNAVNIAQVYAHLASATLSAVHLGASIGSAVNENENFNFECD
jgi:chromosome segregation ATPase